MEKSTIDAVKAKTTNFEYEEIDYSDFNSDIENMVGVDSGGRNLIPIDFFGKDNPITEESMKSYFDYNQKCKEYYFNHDKFKSSYNDFYNCLLSSFYEKKHTDSIYATQGVCSVGGTVFTTAYNSYSDLDLEVGVYSDTVLSMIENQPYGNNSILEMTDQYGRYKRLYFSNDSHVGSIVYHESSGSLLVADGGYKTISYYKVNDIATAKDNSLIEPYLIQELSETPSYITIHGDTLYVGTFKESNSNSLFRYKITDDGLICEREKLVVPLPATQGMCVYNDGQQDYYIFSCSYRREDNYFNKMTHELNVMTMDENGNFLEYGYLPIPPMSEQISLTDSGDLLLVFESDAVEYDSCSLEIGDVVTLNPGRLIEYSYRYKNQ